MQNIFDRDLFPTIYRLLTVLGVGQFNSPRRDDELGATNKYTARYTAFTCCVVVSTSVFTIFELIGTFSMDLSHARFMFGLTFCFGHAMLFSKLYAFIFRAQAIKDIIRDLVINLPSIYSNHVLRKQATVSSNKNCFLLLCFASMVPAALIIDEYDQMKKEKRSFALMVVWWPYDSTNTLCIIIKMAFILIVFFSSVLDYIAMNLATFYLLNHLRVQFKQVQDYFENISDIVTMKMNSGELTMTSTDARNNILISNGGGQSKLLDSTKLIKINFEKNVLNEVNNVVRFHCMVLRCTNRFQDALGLSFMFSIVQNIVLLSTVLARMMMDRSPTVVSTGIAMILAQIIELGCYTWNAGDITHEALNISSSAVRWPWLERDVRVRRMLMIVLARAQRPVVLHAARFIDLSHETFVWVCRRAYSAFAVIFQNRQTL